MNELLLEKGENARACSGSCRRYLVGSSFSLHAFCGRDLDLTELGLLSDRSGIQWGGLKCYCVFIHAFNPGPGVCVGGVKQHVDMAQSVIVDSDTFSGNLLFPVSV